MSKSWADLDLRKATSIKQTEDEYTQAMVMSVSLLRSPADKLHGDVGLSVFRCRADILETNTRAAPPKGVTGLSAAGGKDSDDKRCHQ